MTNQLLKDFRNHLLIRIEDLQKTHQTLQQLGADTETSDEQRDYISSMAAGIWDRKIEMEKVLEFFDQASTGEYLFEVTKFTYYKTLPSEINVTYPNGQKIGFSQDKSPTDSLFYSLFALLDMAEHMWKTGGISDTKIEEGQEVSATPNTETGA